jgi:hypothetical protein
MWCGKAFYGVGIQSFRILFLLFVSVVVVIVVFFQVWLQESILFGLLKASQPHLELAAGQGGGLAGHASFFFLRTAVTLD